MAARDLLSRVTDRAAERLRRSLDAFAPIVTYEQRLPPPVRSLGFQDRIGNQFLRALSSRADLPGFVSYTRTASNPFGPMPGMEPSRMMPGWERTSARVPTPTSSLYEARIRTGWERQKEAQQRAPQAQGDAGLTGGTPLYDSNLEGALKWKPQAQQVAQEFGIPWEVLIAVMAIESGGDQNAYSPAGAVGLMQIIPKHHQGRANKYGGNLWDPMTNLRTAADFLLELYQQWGSWDKAVAGYFGALDAYGNITDVGDGGTTGTAYVQKFRNYYAALTTPRPAGPGVFGGQPYVITQGFWNYNPDLYRNNGGHHTGIDFAVPEGTPLYAGVEGTVIHAGEYGTYGIAVIVQTSFGIVIYGHLSSTGVQVGQRVNASTFIGRSGNTGYSLGPHLHLEVRDHNGNYLDPSRYVAF